MSELDVANLAEEIESMGRKDEKGAPEQSRRRDRPSSEVSVPARATIERVAPLRSDEGPEPPGHAVAIFAQSYADAREQASAETGLPVEAFPERSP